MTSVFFQKVDYRPEQVVLEDLVQEAISIHGLDLIYLPRKTYSIDGVFSEDAQFYYDDAAPFDGYLKNADHFGGDGAYLSQFGIELRDRVTFTVSRRHWAERVGNARGLARPDEGDLIWFAPNQRLFQVRYVDRYSMLYPLGTLPAWEITCELIEASSSRFDTGITAIDAFEQETTEDLYRDAVRTVGGSPIYTCESNLWVVDSRKELIIDPLDETVPIHAGADVIIDFTEENVFAEEPF